MSLESLAGVSTDTKQQDSGRRVSIAKATPFELRTASALTRRTAGKPYLQAFDRRVTGGVARCSSWKCSLKEGGTWAH